jgi:hypothetical protein
VLSRLEHFIASLLCAVVPVAERLANAHVTVEELWAPLCASMSWRVPFKGRILCCFLCWLRLTEQFERYEDFRLDCLVFENVTDGSLVLHPSGNLSLHAAISSA